MQDCQPPSDFYRLWKLAWEKIEADPTLIADDGFYFLGDVDGVKCWYCNRGLKNWERFDDPWTEHAKWFSLCEYLLKNKGVDFVKGVVKDFPGLERPTISHPPPEEKLQGLQKLVKNQPPAKRQPPFPPFIDPKGVVDMKEKVERKCCWVRT